jgi:hypothetical protein
MIDITSIRIEMNDNDPFQNFAWYFWFACFCFSFVLGFILSGTEGDAVGEV